MMYSNSGCMVREDKTDVDYVGRWGKNPGGFESDKKETLNIILLLGV